MKSVKINSFYFNLKFNFAEGKILPEQFQLFKDGKKYF